MVLFYWRKREGNRAVSEGRQVMPRGVDVCCSGNRLSPLGTCVKIAIMAAHVPNCQRSTPS